MASTLDEMEARARRHLDGMTVNRDAMAKDVLQLVAALRAAQAQHAQAKAQAQEDNNPFGWIDQLKPRRA